MKKLGIYGAGGLGREVLILANRINAERKQWSDFFFIDDAFSTGELKGIGRLSFEDFVKDHRDAEVVIAVGEPSIREVLAHKVEAAAVPLVTLVHPGVEVPACTKVGAGTIICGGCFISCDVEIEKNVLLQPNASVGHDSRIGSHSIISTYVSIAGACEIGRRVYIGLNAAVREKTTIGDDAIVGMGAAVFSDIPEAVIALGNPARVMRENAERRVFKS